MNKNGTQAHQETGCLFLEDLLPSTWPPCLVISLPVSLLPLNSLRNEGRPLTIESPPQIPTETITLLKVMDKLLKVNSKGLSSVFIMYPFIEADCFIHYPQIIHCPSQWEKYIPGTTDCSLAMRLALICKM